MIKIPPEAIKKNLNFWAPILALLILHLQQHSMAQPQNIPLSSWLHPQTLRDNFQSTWKKALVNNTILGFSPDFLLSIEYDQAKAFILITYNGCCFFHVILNQPQITKPSDSLQSGMMSRPLLEGQYRQFPYLQRQCPCDSEHTETTKQVLLQCPYYKDIHANLISAILYKYSGCTGQFQTSLLLANTNPASS